MAKVDGQQIELGHDLEWYEDGARQALDDGRIGGAGVCLGWLEVGLIGVPLSDKHWAAYSELSDRLYAAENAHVRSTWTAEERK